MMLMVLMVAVLPADEFVREWQVWHEQRDANLRKADGWLSLAGLFWLREGESSFGSGEGCDVRFPRGPSRMGTFRLQDDGTVTVAIDAGVGVMREGVPVTSLVIEPSAPEGRDVLTLGSLRWYVIRRDDRVGIRLKDSDNPARAAFRGNDAYPPDPRWRIAGRFEACDPQRKRRVPTALGTTTEMTVAGVIAFAIDGQPCRLEAYDEEAEERLFVIFRDATSGHETYGAGRYLYADRPDATGAVILDFNRAYNPPCAFTHFATCSYPPKENHLTVPVLAGEKTYVHEEK